MRKTYLYALLLVSTLLPIQPAHAAEQNSETTAVPIQSRFENYGHDGAFLLKIENNAAQTLYGKALSMKRLPPASTFKVLLALVALETGVLKSVDEVLPWDGQPYPNKPEWEADMALKQAMQTSSENYFGTLSKRIGQKRLAKWVKKLNYGNRKIGVIPEKAWHDGVLTVTANEQLDFIDRMRRAELPVSNATMEKVKSSMFDSEASGHRIYGKSGSHSGLNQGPGVGWWIGWVEGPNTDTSFVLQIDLKAMDNRAQRLNLGKQLMMDVGVLPAK
jgi:beta-lactamase class D